MMYVMSELPGMIDWLTLRIDASLLSQQCRDVFKNNADKVQKISATTGEIVWESNCRETIRSDSHQINIQFGSYLQIMGSPARVKNRNNVFGSFDIQECFNDVIRFVSLTTGVFLPRNVRDWSCTRIDVTKNYDLGSNESVLQAIDCLKVCKVGRQKPWHFDTSVGWGGTSTLHKGKAYAKGQHVRKESKKQTDLLDQEQLLKSDRLLRLEYQICRHLIKRLSESGLQWHQLTPQLLSEMHDQYFSKFISEIEVTDMDNILQLLLSNVGQDDGQIPTEGQARSSYDCYTRFKLMGYHQTKSSYSRTTFFRHLKNLKSIGLTEADLQTINVIPLKKRQIVLGNPVSSWDDIKLA